MLCRALLVAAVLSYVLCVLLLSGVQKEDIDAGTLRKLQRHNVNIDDINDRQVQERCLGTTVIPINLTTLEASSTTEETTTEKTVNGKGTSNEIYKNVGSIAADSTPLQKIVEYLEYKQKEERRKALQSKDSIRMSKLESDSFTTLPSRSFSEDQPRRIKIEDPSTESAQKIVNSNDDEKINKANMNKELENFMKMWQTNIERMSKTTKQESTTIKILKDDVMSKNTKDVEYITKIVEEIMSKRQFSAVKTSTVVPKHNFSSNVTFQNVEQALSAQSKNGTFLPSSYFLNNCKLGNILANKAHAKEKSEVVENLTERLSYDVNSPVTNINHNDEYVICKRFESKGKEQMPPHRIDDYTINYILNKIRKESQGINSLDSESSTFGTLLKNQPNSAVLNPHSDKAKIANTYKESFNMLDNESAKALQDELENQSKSIFFPQQAGRMKISDYKNSFNKLEDESAKAFETGLENQPKIQHFDHGVDHSNNKKKQNNYPRFIEENMNMWAKYIESLRSTQEPKLEDEPTEKALDPSKFRYKAAKQDDNDLEEYKKLLFRYHKPSNKQEASMKTKQNSMSNNRADDHGKSTNIMNSVQYDPNHDDNYKLPWLYGGSSSEQFGPKIKGKQNGALFKPKDQNKITNAIDPRLQIAYKKIWPPFFEAVNNNTSFIPAEEHEISKNNQEPVLVDPDSPQLINPNYREISPEGMDVSKKYTDFVGWYPKKNPYVIDDQSNKQFGAKGGQNLIQAVSSARQNKIDPRHNDEFKSNWAYFRNDQIDKHNSNIEEEHGEPYLTDSKSSQQNNYQYLPRPYEDNYEKPFKDTGAIKKHYGNIVKEKLPEANEKKDNTMFPPFPPNVIKDIANSVKEIVLRDLKTTTIIPITTTLTTTTQSTTTTPTTTTSTTTTSTTTTSTTTKSTTTTTPTTTTARTTTSTTESTTTEGTSTTTKDPLKIKDSSKALEKIIEMFEKISSIKDKMVTLDNVKNNMNVHYDMPTTTTTTTPRSLIIQTQEQEYKSGSPLLYPPNPLQLGAGNRFPYNIQGLQLKTENLMAYDSQSTQFKTENRAPYASESVQLNAGNHIPYNPQQLKEENHVLFSQSPQVKIENHVPYETQSSQQKIENRIPYNPQAVQFKAENDIQYNQQVELQAGNSIQYTPQVVQLKAENRLPYNPIPLQLKADNNIQYDPRPVQSKPENRIPYDYSAKSPYYHSKIEYDPYFDKEVLQPVNLKPRNAHRAHAITVQTNSGEIAPLKITVKKPLVQNIVLTTKKAPIKEDNDSYETYNFRKPITSANRHHVDNDKLNEATHAREKKPVVTRHTHRDTYLDIPKSRKIKKDGEFTDEEYKPRDMQAIERFHEKLERGDAWPRYEQEKIAQRMQRPLVKKNNYDDTHFRNFLQTQQKVNAMLEKILGSSKNKPGSSEV